jgi:hypothetical protein
MPTKPYGISIFYSQKKKTRKKINEKKIRETRISGLSHWALKPHKKGSLSLSLCSIQIFHNLSFVQTILFLILYFIYLPSIFLTIIVLYIYIYIKFIRYYHSLPSNYTETRASIWGVLICFGFSRVRVRVFAFAF